MGSALILPNIGTVVKRADGSVVFTDRNRQHFEIAKEVVAAIVELSIQAQEQQKGAS